MVYRGSEEGAWEEADVVVEVEVRQPVSRSGIRDNLLPLIQLPGIVLPGKRRFGQVFDLYVDLNVSFADAYHAVLMQRLKIEEIVSFDKGPAHQPRLAPRSSQKQAPGEAEAMPW
jgi:predicted nucleic acid-binding protein